ncbi:MAG: gliding motility-associated C-terminal domain-containing protein [Bacteroidales bacterium]|nr:gliding motility-associated C-terminal domain-containing protein [Bacteroidales bacterium]
MRNIGILIVLLLLFSPFVNAQREANIWYFGIHAGIDFNSGVAVPLTDGKINRWEGVASFCDSLGNLLFYTDGDSVWNAIHEPMENGYDLLGDPSSTESAIIIPYPDNDSLYYIFTIDEEGGEDGLCYSIVNMNNNNGLGAITTKNIQLVTPVVEKLTAVRHKNNSDFWVISHGWETDSFFVYIVTPTGINPTPQIFEVGAIHKDIGLHGNNAVGYLRVSPDGSRLASALQVSQLFEVFDFDNETGEISNPISIPQPIGSPYGVEFSPDASKLYMTSGYDLYQADITLATEEDINNSVTLIGSSETSNFFGAVQLATDGKIYLAHEFNDYLGVINDPTEAGDSCHFELYGFYLAGKQSRMGLPDFIQTYFLPPDFKYINFCFGDSTLFFIADTFGIDSVSWNFGDTLSIENTSKDFSPKHVYLSAGKYFVILTLWKNGVDYYKKQIIQINPLPNIFLGNDTLICSGDSIMLVAECTESTFLWNTLSTDSTIWINSSGEYSVLVTKNYTYCQNSDTIFLDISPLPSFNIGQDTGFCKNDSILLHVEYENAQFLWNTGETNDSIYVEIQNTYILEITDTLGCKNKDTIFIEEYQLPSFNLGNDTVICPETQINITTNISGIYLWSDSTTANYITINQGGEFWLKITNENSCTFSDTIIITDKNFPIVNLGNDTLICEDDYLILKASPVDCYYLWSDGTNGNEFEVSEPGNYILYSTNICGTDVDSIFVDFEYCGEIYIPNIFTPNNDGINETFYIKGILHETWQIFIYNRWGEIVYESEDYKGDWDGGKCSEGTYYYILQKPDTETIFSGHVRIYR